MSNFQINYTGQQVNELLAKADTALQEVPDIYALKSEIPTNNNQLTNGAGYITTSYHDSTKQDVISNLSTIIANATAGKGASDTIASYGDIVTHNADEFATTQSLTNKMVRYIVKLVKNGENYSIQTYDGVSLDFDTLSTQIKNVSNYVVMIYGNSKLRPQYVSTNEMMFIGTDRSQNTKILRVIFTPARCSYETFELVETADLLEKSVEEWQFTLATGEVVVRKVVLGE